MSRRRKILDFSLAMPFAEYRELVGVNWSGLKNMARSPMHFKWAREQPPEDRVLYANGRAGHTAVLEPDRFPLEYAVWTGERRAGKEWEAFREANTARTIIKADEYQRALAIRDSIRAHKAAGRVLSKGLPERTIVWTDPETGILCRGRVDYLREDGVVDIKITSDIDERRFSVRAFNYAYHCQLAFYSRGLRALGLAEPKAWMIVVESDPPHDVAAWELDPGVIATGDEQVGKLLAQLKSCEASKKWPGRYPELGTFFLPGWAYSAPETEEAEALGLNVGGAV